jgi:Flp pilus assembly pilin Flp
LSSLTESLTTREASGNYSTGGNDMTDTLNSLYIRLTTLAKSEDGQTMAEYGIILVVIALVAVVGFTTLGGEIQKALDAVAAKV